MPTDYQRKYLECVKVYHQLHAELASLTMKLENRILKMKIPAQYKSTLFEVAYEGADRIKEVDLKFRDLVRTNWLPPEKRADVTMEDLLC